LLTAQRQRLSGTVASAALPIAARVFGQDRKHGWSGSFGAGFARCGGWDAAETGTGDQAMTIESTAFGSITVDGKTYEHDVIIRLSGEVVKRKKMLSKKYYGTSHVISEDEAKFAFERGCEQLIVGSGQMGNVHLSPEAEAYFAKKGCEVFLLPTPEAIDAFNKSKARKAGLFHVTC